jgi:hypothetical protein
MGIGGQAYICLVHFVEQYQYRYQMGEISYKFVRYEHVY